VPKTYNTVLYTLHVYKLYKYSVLIKSYSEIELRLSPPSSLAGLESYVRLQALVLLFVFSTANTYGLLLFAMYSSFDLTAISALKPLTSDLLFTIACLLFYLLYLLSIKRLKQLITDYFKLCLN
jgi:hypothetical protein